MRAGCGCRGGRRVVGSAVKGLAVNGWAWPLRAIRSIRRRAESRSSTAGPEPAGGWWRPRITRTSRATAARKRKRFMAVIVRRAILAPTVAEMTGVVSFQPLSDVA